MGDKFRIFQVSMVIWSWKKHLIRHWQIAEKVSRTKNDIYLTFKINT